MSVAALVTGILSLLCSAVPVLGIVLGVIAICCARSSKTGEKMDGLAVGGLVCGIVGLCICGIVSIATGCVVCAFNA